MSADITPNQEHAVIDVKIAITPKYSKCPDSIADGLNQLLGDEIDEGFIADYAFYNSDSPRLVMASSDAEEGELFVEVGENNTHNVDVNLTEMPLVINAVLRGVNEVNTLCKHGEYPIDPGGFEIDSSFCDWRHIKTDSVVAIIDETAALFGECLSANYGLVVEHICAKITEHFA